MKNRKNKAKSFRLSRRSAALVILVVALVCLGVLELSGTTHILHKAKPVSGTIPSTNPNSKSTTGSSAHPNAQSPSSTGSDSTSNDKSSTAVSNSSAPLITPYGTFVSNHHPSLSSSGGVPSDEQSVCTTTPGAVCSMSFSGNGVTKTLDAQTADSRGSVYWTWNVKTAGFTEGQWTITVTATLNGTSKSTTDQLPLTVQP